MERLKFVAYNYISTFIVYFEQNIWKLGFVIKADMILFQSIKHVQNYQYRH